jgi:metallo-beta-lactamase family protein
MFQNIIDYTTHGEPQVSIALKLHIESELAWHCEIPKYLDKVML